MQITVSQLQNKHRLLVDALKRGESVELTYHGKVLGVIQPGLDQTHDQIDAMNDFFGMHKNAGIQSVEEELRQVRKGRIHRDAI